MHKFLLIIFFSVFSLSGISQNEDDALRYTMTYFGGTARNMSMAGAFSALGGDYSCVLQNPAGLGRFKKNNYSFTSNFEHPVATSGFYGNTLKSSAFDYKIGNLSFIKAYELDPRSFSNWYGVQLGMGYNRINSFEEKFEYQGEVDSSILHSFIREANGTHPDNIYSAFPFSAGLAYDTYALDPGNNNTYVTDFTSGTAIHNRTVSREGGMAEYNFSLSGNYANKLLLGGSVNLTRVKYYENYTHEETYTDTSLWIQNIRYLGELDIKGWGYNARIGAIYFPAEFLRIGFAVQTPTVFLLQDNWSNNMNTRTDDGLKSVDPNFVPYGQYDYKVTSPVRANASIGVVLKKYGSIGAEVEYVNYAKSRLASRKFSESHYSFITENTQIDNIYQSVLNIKIGTEIRLTNQWYLRGGYALYPSPYKASSGNNTDPVQFYTGGFGYNMGKYYIDFAYLLKDFNRDYYAYDPTINGSHAKLDFNNSQFVLTVGMRIK